MITDKQKIELLRNFARFVKTHSNQSQRIWQEAQKVIADTEPAATSGEQGEASITAYPESDGVEHVHPSYGRGVFFTYNCAQELYTHPAPSAQDAQDARRYRFMRDASNYWISIKIAAEYGNFFKAVQPGTLDDRIDAAMRATEAGGVEG